MESSCGPRCGAVCEVIVSRALPTRRVSLFPPSPPLRCAPVLCCVVSAVHATRAQRRGRDRGVGETQRHETSTTHSDSVHSGDGCVAGSPLRLQLQNATGSQCKLAAHRMLIHLPLLPVSQTPGPFARRPAACRPPRRSFSSTRHS